MGEQANLPDHLVGFAIYWVKTILGSGNFPGLGLLAGILWAQEELLDSDSDSPPAYDQLAPDQGPFPGALGKVVHPVGVVIGDPRAEPQPWTSARDAAAGNRRYDFIVDRGAQVWWPGDTPTTGAGGGLGYRGRWGPVVTSDPSGRRAGMSFPEFWRSFLLAFADGKAKKIL